MLFGMNLEITRETMFMGLGAEMLNNRKFFSQGGAGVACWDIEGGAPLSCADASYDRREGVPLDLLLNTCRVRQYTRCVAIRAGARYAFRVRFAAEGAGELRVAVSLGGARAACAHRASGIRAFEGVLTATCDADSLPFAVEFSAAPRADTSLALLSVSLVPEGAYLGYLREDVVEALASLKPGCLRFPGGCYAEYYRWKQGLLPRDERPVVYEDGIPFLLRQTADNDPQDMNVDDFVSLCRRVGAQPELTVRVSETEAEEAAELVAYCNLGADDPWGRVRAERGYARPHAVRHWYIGNELAFFGRSGERDPIVAATRTVEFARAMKAADPTIELTPSNWGNSGWNARYLAEIVRLGGDALFSLASYHRYLLDVLDGGAKIEVDTVPDPSPDRIGACLKGPTQVVLPLLRAARDELDAAGGAFCGMPIAMDEWNYYWHKPGHPVLALYTAGMLNALIRCAEPLNVRQALYFHPINEGLIDVGPDGAAHTDGGRLWALSREHAGRRALPLSLERLDGADGADGPAVDAAATVSGGEAYMTIVNRDVREEAVVELHGLRAPSGTLLYCGDVLRDGFVPGSLEERPAATDGEVLRLPPASYAAIRLEVV
ncbi:MAG: hypothetical protein GX558_12440 [Clostridiales bacterium]|nr:hypothetical protein [Clostridiales bacterium]